MKAAVPFAIVLVLLGVGYVLGPVARLWFAVVLPYISFAVFLMGLVYRVAMVWGRAPVPFAIGTTCGQQKSLPWIRSAAIENPSTRVGVMVRLLLEIAVFRSLFRAARTRVVRGPRLVVDGQGLLWTSAMLFHWSLLVVALRHLRFFVDPVPSFLRGLLAADGFFDVGVPTVYLSGFGLLAAACVLLGRRFLDAQVRYISLPSDYFSLFLVLGIVCTGVVMRNWGTSDVASVKEMAMGLANFRPIVPRNVEPVFYSHLLLVCVLLVTIPFSKLTHAAGVFLSPTRNLRCNSREIRHINPWNGPVRVRTYSDYEEEYRDKLIAVDLPVESRTKTSERNGHGEPDAAS